MLGKGKGILVFIVLITISACGSQVGRLNLANSLAMESKFSQNYLQTYKNKPAVAVTSDNRSSGGRGGVGQDVPGFKLLSYYKITNPKLPVNVYIEGDGFAWVNASRLSSNPTPKDAFTLKLATLDPAANVIYIARPCQYVEADPKCSPKYWSGSRFAKEVVDSIDNVIDYYSKDFQPQGQKKLNLIGYSGGAAIAVLVAAERDDIISLRTVAGNLDHKLVNSLHNVTQLDNSLNAIDVAEKIANLPQHHFVGTEDTVVPIEVTRSFVKKIQDKPGSCVRMTTISGASHYDGWQENWQQILAKPLFCSGYSF